MGGGEDYICFYFFPFTSFAQEMTSPFQKGQCLESRGHWQLWADGEKLDDRRRRHRHSGETFTSAYTHQPQEKRWEVNIWNIYIICSLFLYTIPFGHGQVRLNWGIQLFFKSNITITEWMSYVLPSFDRISSYPPSLPIYLVEPQEVNSFTGFTGPVLRDIIFSYLCYASSALVW